MCIHPTEDDIHCGLRYDKLDVEFHDNCNYVDIDDSVDIICTDNDLKVIFLNIRGLLNKQIELSHLLYHCLGNQKVDVVILAKIWHMPQNVNRISLPGYVFHGKPQPNRVGGGVGFLINDQLSYKVRPDLEIASKQVEHSVVDIKLKHKTVTLNAIYRPPNTNQDIFITWFHELHDKLMDNKCKDFVMGLDHNMDLLKHDQNSKTQLLFESMLDRHMMPCIMKPTRITKDTATLIDNILLSRELHAKQLSGIIISDISDHLPCLVIISNCKSTPKELIQTFRKLNKKNTDLINKKLGAVNWTDIIGGKQLDAGSKLFHEKLLQIIDEIASEQSQRVPIKKVIGQPWMTKGLLRYSKKQLSLYKTALCTKSADDTDVNRCYKLRSNTKKLWNLINSVTGKLNDKSCIISKILDGNVNYIQADQIANALGNQFANVGKNYAQKIKSDVNIKEYLAKISQNNRSVYLSPTNRTEILRLIDNLPNKNSSGWDDISNKLLKQIKLNIVEPLCILFNDSLKNGIFPNIMKLANVVPLYKLGKKCISTNYRPISLLITISKVLEKIVYSRIYNFLTITKQLYCGQYGFRKQHSCEHAVQELVGNILKGYEKKEYTIAVYLDLSKAFNMLEHDVLLNN